MAEGRAEAHGQVRGDRIVVEHADIAVGLDLERRVEQGVAVEDDGLAGEVLVGVAAGVDRGACDALEHGLRRLIEFGVEDGVIGALEQIERALLSTREETEEAQIIEDVVFAELNGAAEIGVVNGD